MQVEYLIIGQGICGTFLSWYLQNEKKSFCVIDNNNPVSASKVAAGIINPVTGRRIVNAWMIKELIPFVWDVYNKIGNELGIKAISQKNIIDFFPTPQMMLAFQGRLLEDETYLYTPANPDEFTTLFNYDFGCGGINPAYIVHLENILPAWREKLKQGRCLLEENFSPKEVTITAEQITYKNIIAEKIIFCDGINSFYNPLFHQLPFAPNKGEVLIIEAPDLSADYIFKKGIMLAPLEKPGHFWVGSNYLWNFVDGNPSETFRKQTEFQLKEWLKVPFKIVDHKAGIRPATIERRPFVGMHPFLQNVGILNGMGTKGCSLAPWFARQLTRYLIYDEPLAPDADLRRFQRVLSRER